MKLYFKVDRKENTISFHDGDGKLLETMPVQEAYDFAYKILAATNIVHTTGGN